MISIRTLSKLVIFSLGAACFFPSLVFAEDTAFSLEELKGSWKVNLKAWREGNKNPSYLNGKAESVLRLNKKVLVSDIILKGAGDKYSAFVNLLDKETPGEFELSWIDTKNLEIRVLKGKNSAEAGEVSFHSENGTVEYKRESADKFKIIFLENQKVRAELTLKRR